MPTVVSVDSIHLMTRCQILTLLRDLGWSLPFSGILFPQQFKEGVWG